jgi:hypothetical protein
MLAPLRDRTLIERESPASDEERIARLEAANRALVAALRQARQDLRRSVAASTRKIVAQANEISRLQTLVDGARRREAAFESGYLVIKLGQRLDAHEEAVASLAGPAGPLHKCDWIIHASEAIARADIRHHG